MRARLVALLRAAHRLDHGASIGQVHRARLRSGEFVAVKVQYPGVDVRSRCR
jgi:hypothetical protein